MPGFFFPTPEMAASHHERKLPSTVRSTAARWPQTFRSSGRRTEWPGWSRGEPSREGTRGLQIAGVLYLAPLSTSSFPLQTRLSLGGVLCFRSEADFQPALSSREPRVRILLLHRWSQCEPELPRSGRHSSQVGFPRVGPRVRIRSSLQAARWYGAVGEGDGTIVSWHILRQCPVCRS